MKKIFFPILLSLFISSCIINNIDQSLDQSNNFVQGSEDIPLVNGMNKIPHESLGFDSDSGSIISSSYKTENSIRKVRNFYITTLPQMGWKITNKGFRKMSFSRDDENLEIEFDKEQNIRIIRFFISSSI